MNIPVPVAFSGLTHLKVLSNLLFASIVWRQKALRNSTLKGIQLRFAAEHPRCLFCYRAVVVLTFKWCLTPLPSTQHGSHDYELNSCHSCEICWELDSALWTCGVIQEKSLAVQVYLWYNWNEATWTIFIVHNIPLSLNYITFYIADAFIRSDIQKSANQGHQNKLQIWFDKV